MKKTRKNKFDIEWHYAQAIWNALTAGLPIPPIPKYSVWEVDEKGRENLVGQVLCDVMVVIKG